MPVFSLTLALTFLINPSISCEEAFPLLTKKLQCFSEIFALPKDMSLQFESFINSIQPGGVLIYNEEDEILKSLVEAHPHCIKKIPYKTPKHYINNSVTYLETTEGNLPLSVFGEHNLLNLAGAKWITQCKRS